ncbi:MAG: tRNA-dihydrouridine synthase [Spirochaetia bacterium]|nr:tRNA-dihydrouridine synthase [Spirochaetia bacterium]
MTALLSNRDVVYGFRCAPAVLWVPGHRLSIMRIPCFHIGSVPVYGRTALSPMAHFSDSPYRRVCRMFGSAWSVSEFVPATAVVRGEQEFLDRFLFVEEERPVVLQIFGSDPGLVSDAAAIAAGRGADAVELNMGCSVRDIVGKGAGAGLLRDSSQAIAIIEAMRVRVNVRNPWIFSNHDGGRSDDAASVPAANASGPATVDFAERLRVVAFHFEWMLHLYGAPTPLFFRKHVARYLPAGVSEWADLREALMACTEGAECRDLLGAGVGVAR